MAEPVPFSSVDADALAMLHAWSHYSGHLDGATPPPPCDLVALARAVRLVLLLDGQIKDDAARRGAERVELEILRASVRTYAKKLERLRAELYAARGEGAPAPDEPDAPEPQVESEAPARKRSAKSFQFPEDAYREGKRGRPA